MTEKNCACTRCEATWTYPAHHPFNGCINVIIPEEPARLAAFHDPDGIGGMVSFAVEHERARLLAAVEGLQRYLFALDEGRPYAGIALHGDWLRRSEVIAAIKGDAP